ncbi:hypothetical protein N0V90_003318 [Kalmusia sp. IMI 367209]|nr:hypothetical protein N0V90_003318 [Kalmusia sp. IMI 367209]
MSLPPSQIMRDWNNDALAAVWAHHQGRTEGIVDVKLELHRACELSNDVLEDCLAIVRHTSMVAYKASSIGWHARAKRHEMSDRNMVYLLIRAAPGSKETFAPSVPTDIIGFISFMITFDDAPHQDRNVIYIYEVHIGEKFRGMGMGKWLVSTVEAMAQMVGINKTMLTVFRSNKGAIKAYENMGYVKDQATPPDREVRRRIVKSDYLIMGKSWSLDSGEIIV